MTGHLEIEAKHMQTVNFLTIGRLIMIIVNDGEQCILKMLFSTTDASGTGRGGHYYCRCRRMYRVP